MTIDLLLSGIAHGRSGGELIAMGEAAGGPACGGPGAPRGRSAAAGREGEPGAPGPGCGAAGRCARGAGIPPVPGAGDARRRPAAGRRARGARCPVIGAQAAFPPGACGGLRTILRPAAVTTAPQESVNCPARSPTRNSTQAARWPGFIRNLRAAAGLPSRTTGRRPVPPWSGEWPACLALTAGTPRPCPRINAAGIEAVDAATLPRVLRLPSVNVADLAFKSVAR